MLDFQEARLLQYSQESRFLGNGVRFGTQKNITIEGSFYSLSNASGVKAILEDAQSFVADNQDWRPVEINGHSFGNGKITSIDLQESNDIRSKNYTVSLFVLDETDLDGLGGDLYPDNFAHAAAPLYKTDNIDENLEITRENDTFSYVRTLSVRFQDEIQRIQKAQFLAKRVFDNTFTFDFLIDQSQALFGKSGKKTYQENYNLISGEATFTENFITTNDAIGNDYSTIINHQFIQNEDGTIDVTETGEVWAITDSELSPLADTMRSGLQTEVNNAFGRCNSVFGQYAPSNSHTLNNVHTELSKNLNTFNGQAEYAITFTNNPAFENSGYSLTYQHSVERSQEEIWTASESGEIIGLGFTLNNRNDNALAGFNNQTNLIQNRVQNFYENKTGLFYTLARTSTNRSLDRFNGTVSYNFSYTDNPQRVNTNIAVENVEVVDEPPNHFFNTFEIPGHGEIIQSAQSSTVGTKIVTISLEGFRDTTFDQFKQRAVQLANAEIPLGDDDYLESCNYTLERPQRELNATISWNVFDSVPEERKTLV